MKKILVLFLTIITLFSMISCGKNNNSKQLITMSADEVYKLNISQLDADILPVITYVAPTFGEGKYPNIVTDEIYALAKEGGVNMIMGHNEGSNEEKVNKQLDMCEKYNMGYLVHTGEIGYFANDGSNGCVTYKDFDEDRKAELDNNLSTIINKFKDKKAFAGIKFADEQGLVQFEGIKYAKQQFDKICSDKLFYSNLVGPQQTKYGMYNAYSFSSPTGEIPSKLYSEGWKYYLSQSHEICGLNLLSYDVYPYNNVSKINSVYFNAMIDAYSVAQNNKIPWWNFVQCYGSKNNAIDMARDMNYEEVAYNINTSLAFGAKGLEIFTYFTPYEYASTPDDYVFAFDAYGNKMKYYDYYKEVLNDIKPFQHVLMNSTFKGIVSSKEKRPYLAPSPSIELQNFNELIGIKALNTYAFASCMNYNGKTALYVVNASIDKNDISDITLNFSRKLKLKYYYNREEKEFIGQNFNLYDLEAGDGAMIILEDGV